MSAFLITAKSILFGWATGSIMLIPVYYLLHFFLETGFTPKTVVKMYCFSTVVSFIVCLILAATIVALGVL